MISKFLDFQPNNHSQSKAVDSPRFFDLSFIQCILSLSIRTHGAPQGNIDFSFHQIKYFLRDHLDHTASTDRLYVLIRLC